jgi:hypothetical protein
MLQRSLLLLTAALAAMAMAVTPALAGEDPGDGSSPPAVTPPAPATPAPAPPPATTGSARLRTSQGCVAGNHAKAVVSGTSIKSVAFFVDGRRVKRVTAPDAGGRFTLTMNCAHLRVGAHRGKATVAFQAGVSPTRRTLRFQITRARQSRPQFTG